MSRAAPIDSGKAARSFAIVALLLGVFLAFGSSWISRRMGGVAVLDVDLWRSPDDVEAALAAYGEVGRMWYFRYLVADTAFAILYALLLPGVMRFASLQLPIPHSISRALPAVPFIGGLIFDLGENLLLGSLAYRYPDPSSSVSWIACEFSAVKFTAFTLSVVISLWGLFFAGMRFIRGRNQG